MDENQNWWQTVSSNIRSKSTEESVIVETAFP